MSYIKLVRLKTGEDVISFVEIDKKTIKLIHPLNVYITYNKKTENQELVLNFWLPINIVEKNWTILPINEILFVSEVKKDFQEYYLNFLNDFDFEKENEEKEEIKNMLDLFDSQHNKLH